MHVKFLILIVRFIIFIPLIRLLLTYSYKRVDVKYSFWCSVFMWFGRVCTMSPLNALEKYKNNWLCIFSSSTLFVSRQYDDMGMDRWMEGSSLYYYFSVRRSCCFLYSLKRKYSLIGNKNARGTCEEAILFWERKLSENGGRAFK